MDLHYLTAAVIHAHGRFVGREVIGYLEFGLALVAQLSDGDAWG